MKKLFTLFGFLTLLNFVLCKNNTAETEKNPSGASKTQAKTEHIDNNRLLIDPSTGNYFRPKGGYGRCGEFNQVFDVIIHTNPIIIVSAIYLFDLSDNNKGAKFKKTAVLTYFCFLFFKFCIHMIII